MNQVSSGITGVSVVLPILNEERHLYESISAILAQDFSGDFEVILALGPSRDRTSEIASELAAKDSRVVLVENPTGRTASGLNAAIARAKYSIISRIDGHSEISPTYLRDAIAILNKSGAVNVGGIMAAVGKSKFEKAVATAMRSPLGVGSSRFHTGGIAGPADTVYLGTFQKSALLAAGGYDERFTRAQDWELNFRLRKNGGTIWFDPSLVVTYRPRSTLKALTKQYFQYGTWRRAVSRSHSGSVNLRYLAPPTALVINALSIIFGLIYSPIFLIPVATYLASIIFGSLVIGKTMSDKLILPVVLLTMHMVWGAGYLFSPRNLLAEAE
ncbi:MAG: glycosyltransferase family 2 protein [Candidatus Nanopelagicaceae bacterium]